MPARRATRLPIPSGCITAGVLHFSRRHRQTPGAHSVQKMTDATADTVVEAPATPWDVMITLTEVEGNLTFEGRMNPDKAPDDVATSALAFTNFLADQLPMLVQMASASTQIKQAAPAESTALIDSGFTPTGTPRQIVGLVGEAISSTDASVETT